MFKRIKEVFLILFCVLVLASPGFAASESDTVTIAIYNQFSVLKTQDMSIVITPQEGTSLYSDFTSSTPAHFLATGDPSKSVVITCNSPITLTGNDPDSSSATLTFACRAGHDDYAVSETQYNACDDVGLTTSTSGELYISLIPTQVDFGTDNVQAVYTGTVTLTIDYEVQ